MTDLDTPIAAPSGRRRRWWLWYTIATVAVLVIGAGLALWLAPDTFTVRGTLQVPATNECVGTTGYGDIRVGTPVTVTDATGAVVAVGHLGAGSYDGGRCTFPISVDVPAGRGFYGLQVGTRNVLRYAEADIARQPVALALD